MNLVLGAKFHQVSDEQTVSRHHLDEEWPTFCLRIRTEVMKKYVKTLELTGEWVSPTNLLFTYEPK